MYTKLVLTFLFRIETMNRSQVDCIEIAQKDTEYLVRLKSVLINSFSRVNYTLYMKVFRFLHYHV